MISYIDETYDALVTTVMIGIILVPVIVGFVIGIITTIIITRVKQSINARKFIKIQLEQMTQH